MTHRSRPRTRNIRVPTPSPPRPGPDGPTEGKERSRCARGREPARVTKETPTSTLPPSPLAPSPPGSTGLPNPYPRSANHVLDGVGRNPCPKSVMRPRFPAVMLENSRNRSWVRRASRFGGPLLVVLGRLPCRAYRARDLDPSTPEFTWRGGTAEPRTGPALGSEGASPAPSLPRFGSPRPE